MNPSHMKKYTFNNDVWNFAYLLAFSIAFASHSIWLASCSICLDVPSWHGFVNGLPSLSTLVKPDIIISTLSALLIAMSIFVIEGLSNSNSSIKSKVLLNESEIIPLVICFVLVVFQINDQTRILTLIPILLLTIHIIIKFTSLIRLLRHPSRLEVTMQKTFVTAINDSMQSYDAPSDHSIEISEVQELLNEQKFRYLNTLALGDKLEIQRNEKYISLALECILKNEKQAYHGLFIEALDDITTTVNQRNNLNEQKSYLQFVSKLYVYAIRYQSNDHPVSQLIGQSFNKILWIELQESRSDKHQQLITEEIIRLFSGYIAPVLVGTANNTNDESIIVSRFYNLLDTYAPLIGIAIEYHQAESVRKLVFEVNKWVQHYHHLLRESSNIPPHYVYRMIQIKDHFLLMMQSLVLAQSILHNTFFKEIFEALTKVLHDSPLFPSLEQSIMMIESNEDKNDSSRLFNIDHLLRMYANDNEFRFVDTTSIIYTTYMMVRTYLRKANTYSIYSPDYPIQDSSIIDAFAQQIVNLLPFMTEHKHLIHQYAELTQMDIDEILGEINQIKIVIGSRTNVIH